MVIGGPEPWLALATDQGIPFHWKRDVAPELKSSWTEIAQYISRDLPQDFQFFDRSPRGISTVADLISPPAFASVAEACTSFSAPLGGPDRGVACPRIRLRPPPSGPEGEGCEPRVRP